MSRYALYGLGLIAILYLVYNRGTTTKKITYREETIEYVYIHEYKVTRYARKKTETDQGAYSGRFEGNKYVLPRGRELDIWDWSGRE